jgi:hypothetical protein
VISEQGSTLAYAVTEGSETGKSNDLCSSWIGLEYDSSMSRIDTRTQTEGPSLYWYRLYTKESQANTTSSRTRKATNTESTCSSALILVVPVVVIERRRTVWKVTGPDEQVTR